MHFSGKFCSKLETALSGCLLSKLMGTVEAFRTVCSVSHQRKTIKGNRIINGQRHLFGPAGLLILKIIHTNIASNWLFSINGKQSRWGMNVILTSKGLTFNASQQKLKVDSRTIERNKIWRLSTSLEQSTACL